LRPLRYAALQPVSRSIPPKLGLGLALVAVLAAGAVLRWAGSRVVHAGPLVPSTAEAPRLALDRAPPDLATRASLPASGETNHEPDPSPAGAFLAEHFGNEASAVRAALEDQGVDLATTPVPASEAEFQAMLPGWLVFKDSERTAWTEQLLLWPKDLDSAWLQQRLGVIVELSDEELAAVDALAGLYRPDIETAVGRYLDALETAMYDELARGGIQSSPFLAWPPPADNGPPAFFSMVRAGQGWVAQIQLLAENHPFAHVARGEIAVEIERRDADLRQTLLALQ